MKSRIKAYHTTQTKNVASIKRYGFKGLSYFTPSRKVAIKAARQMYNPPSGYRQTGKGKSHSILYVSIPRRLSKDYHRNTLEFTAKGVKSSHILRVENIRR